MSMYLRVRNWGVFVTGSCVIFVNSLPISPHSNLRLCSTILYHGALQGLNIDYILLEGIRSSV
jgi:hypothetical protein